MPNYGSFGLDNTRFRQDIEEARAALNSIGTTAQKNANDMDAAFKRAGQVAAGYFSISAAAGFVSQMVQVRGEFQKLEVSFSTMLGSKEKSNQLMAQMVDTAMKTPFTLQQVAGGAKQLLAYQVAQQDVNNTLLQLGNISAGLGVPLERLIMVYGQVKAKGKLMGDDLRQFTEAGVPMIHELAKSMGIADAEVQKMVSSGKIGFPQVQKVIENLTGAGGMFYNLMEAQSKTVTGQLSNLEDAWSKMLNQIGQSNEGMIYGAISGTSSLITNYETVGKVLAGLIAVYGTYRTAVMVMSVIKATELGLTASEIALNIGKVSSLATATAATTAQTVANVQAAESQVALNAAILANPYVLAAVAVVGLAAAIWAFSDSSTAAELAQKQVTSITEAQTKATDELKGKTVSLTGTINSQTSTILAQITAFKELQDRYPDILANLDLQAFKAMGAAEQQRILNAEIEKQGKKISDNELEKQRALLNTLTAKGISGYTENSADFIKAKVAVGDNNNLGFFQKMKGSTEDYIAVQQQVVDKLEAQKSAQEENIRLSELAKLPVQEQISYYDQQTESLRRQIELLKQADASVNSSAKSMGVLNSKVGDFMAFDEPPKFVDLTGMLIDGLTKKMEEAEKQKKKLTDAEAPKDGTKAFFEVQKKDAENALEKISKEKKATAEGAAEWAKYSALRIKAVEALKFWDFTDKSKTEMSAAQKLAKEKEKIAKEEAQAKINSERSVIDMNFQNEQEEINRKEAGFSRDFDQLVLNNKRRAEEIKRAQENELKIYQKIDDERWLLTAKKDKNGVVIGSNPNKVSLSASSTLAYSEANASNDANLINGKKLLIEKLSKEYQSFDEKRREIDKKYNIDSNDLKENFKGDELLSKLAELAIKKKEALKAIDKDQADSAFKNNALLVNLFDDMATKSVDDLRKIADQAKELYDYLQNTDAKDITPKFGLSVAELTSLKAGKADMKDIADQIKNVNEQADNLETGFKKISTAIKKVSDGSKQIEIGVQLKKDGKALVDTKDPAKIVEGNKKIEEGSKKVVEGTAAQTKGVETLIGAYQTLSGVVGQVQAFISSLSTQEGDLADQTAKSVGAVMKIADSTVNAYTAGGGGVTGAINAAVAFTIGVATQIFESEKAHQAALKKLNDEKIAQQKDYNDLLDKQNSLLKNAETIFGTDSFSKAIGFAQVADKQKGKADNAVSALGGATVQTGSHKGGLFGWGGEVKDYSNLLSQYPALIDGQGRLNKELAQSVLDNQSLDESSKKALQSALDYTKEYEDALKSMGDYLNGVFGSLGQDMMTAITDNLNSAQDAMDAFGKSAGKTIEKLMSDIAYSLFFADKFQKLSDDYKDVMKDKNLTPEEKAAKETKLLGDFYGNVGKDVQDAQDFLKKNKDAATKAGIPTFGADSATRTASEKGVQSMSQQSADELNGRFTAIQGHTFEINESVKVLAENSPKVLEVLMGIKGDTARLQAIENGIKQINDKGVKML